MRTKKRTRSRRRKRSARPRRTPRRAGRTRRDYRGARGRIRSDAHACPTAPARPVRHRTAYINARLLDPASGLDTPGALVIADGRIADPAESWEALRRVTAEDVQKTEQLTAEVQSNARNCLAMIVQKVRSAGWDPADAGIAFVTLDPDLSDSVSELEIFADLDADGPTIGHLKMEGILDKTGHVPLGGDTLCFQASAC